MADAPVAHGDALASHRQRSERRQVEAGNRRIAVAENRRERCDGAQLVEDLRVGAHVTGVHDRGERLLALERDNCARIEPAVRVGDEPHPGDAP